MRGVADEYHAPVHEAVHPSTLERVDADPLELELRRRRPASRGCAAGCSRASSPPPGRHPSPSWKSMRHTSSACRCSSADWSRMKWRVEPEPALGRETRPSCAYRRSGSGRGIPGPSHSSPSMRADRAARAIGGDQPVGLDARIRPSGVSTRAAHPPRPARHPTTLFLHRTSPAGSRPARSTRNFFDPVLLQVDERRTLDDRIPAAGRTRRPARRGSNLARRSSCTPFSHDPLAATEAIENLQRPLGPSRSRASRR